MVFWQLKTAKMIGGWSIWKACRMCEWLEMDGDCELYTLEELFAKMEEVNSGNASTYSEKSLQSKLKEKYRNDIYFTKLPGRPNIMFQGNDFIYFI